MNREQGRLVLLGLANNASRDDRALAITTLMEHVTPEPATRDLIVPFLDGRNATFRVPHQVSAEDWAYLLTVLEAMRSGLVTEVAAPAEEEQR